MKECVTETEAHNFRPLLNLKGLEIMESADHIARGKGNKLLVEDFRVLNEQSDWMEFQNRAEQLYEDAKNEMSTDDFYSFCDAVVSIFNTEVMEEECEGTQCSDIAEKKDQEVGSLQRPKKENHFVEMYKIPKNHGFKGFRLDEYGRYTRGKYILINEDGKIRAVNKNKLEDE
jgi:hypothetical protein